ncbi:hypothetical protein JK169_04520 [Acetobacter persici]|uniref:acyl-homoserine-lactone synthase n=1 Tax=Acetobacter persici TaxID=1076596 RepID=UPI001BAD8936|nr:acyl-homoserine-lactone synthase [Acetobacter persici]MBS1000283.1 hypothetical protein [Acetobacter persici]
MIYHFSYNERNHFPEIYEKILHSRRVFFEKNSEWNDFFHKTPEEDRYDLECNPLYIVAVEDGGDAVASVRILPTTGPTMLRQDFAPFFKGCPDIISPDVWELSWFCTSADTSSPAGRNLLLDVLKTVCEYSLANDIRQIIGTYPRARMRLYRRLGAVPYALCSGEISGQEFCVGVLDITLLTLRHVTEVQQRPF